jgi:oxygen-independent coproporphyrinogen-3 oxidase
MQVLVDRVDASTLKEVLDSQAHADYVYMYPPRQTYRPLDPATMSFFDRLVEGSLARSDDLNVYIHFPFCRQLCSFCNLYTTNNTKQDLSDYVATVLTEASRYARLTDRKRIHTLYIGGGTPSILLPAQIERLITGILGLFSRTPNQAPAETALEVDPSTVDVAKLRDLHAAGVNRINLGYQSMVEQEVILVGRKRSESSGLALLKQALGVGFANVCVDLIYGLKHQTDESWSRSVSEVVEVGPQTICAYALTLRPFTGYRRSGYAEIEGRTLYRRFAIADKILQSAGYRRETHVRWVKAGGGYLQKVAHWGMQNILGLGAGARSYLWDVDYRNGYSVRSRRTTLDQYLEAVSAGLSPVSDGFLMTRSERLRKAALLNLHALNRRWFASLVGVDPLAAFQDEIPTLASLGLCTLDADTIQLTELGIRHRDLIAQCFFSTEVRRRLEEFNYDE